MVSVGGPIAMLEVELSVPGDELIGALLPRGSAPARCLVRVHGLPLGIVGFEPDWDVRRRLDEIKGSLGDAVVRHLLEDGLLCPRPLEPGAIRAAGPAVCCQAPLTGATAPRVSVVVPTKDRPQAALACARSVLACDYPSGSLELIVVDNGSATDATVVLLTDMLGGDERLRVVTTPEPGSSAARTLGARTAEAEIVAFTDDDVRVDRDWIARLVSAFTTDDEVACVTGLVLPAELDTPAQIWFEEFAGFGKGFEPQAFCMSHRDLQDPLFPYQLGRFGSGNNMAFRREALAALGWFNPALGPGTPTHSGEDLEPFVALLLAGRMLVYEPSALVWHTHRRSYDELRTQVYRYGIGLTAALAALVERDPILAAGMLRRLPAALRFSGRRAANGSAGGRRRYPRELQWLELRGMALGPAAYLRSRRGLTRRTESTSPAPAATPTAA